MLPHGLSNGVLLKPIVRVCVVGSQPVEWEPEYTELVALENSGQGLCRLRAKAKACSMMLCEEMPIRHEELARSRNMSVYIKRLSGVIVDQGMHLARLRYWSLHKQR